MSKNRFDQYAVLELIGKGMLAAGFILIAYRVYSGSLMAQNIGILVICISAIWFHFVKKWKKEYELVQMFSEQMIQALSEGRDFQSGMEAFLAKKIDTVSIDLPKQDFRDPAEYTKIKLGDVFEEKRLEEARESNIVATKGENESGKRNRNVDNNSAANLNIVGYAVAEPNVRSRDGDSVLTVELEGFDLTGSGNRKDGSGEIASYSIVCREPLIALLDGKVDQGTVMQIVGEMKTVELTHYETGSYFYAEEVLASDVKILSNEKKPYTYIEADSSLYGPDGTFIKQIYCPKAVDWNQLEADDPKKRSRGCTQCSKRVMNLDVVPVLEVLETFKKYPSQCVFGSSKSIRFLRDQKRPKHPSRLDGTNPVTIYTVRSFEDIRRGISDGFWPDVRLVTYNTKQLMSKFALSQNKKTGEIDIGYDLREGSKSLGDWHGLIDFTYYYPYYQKTPIAAYLIPKKLPAGTPVIVPDPIEDILGSDSGQNDTGRALNVRGVWDGERIVLNVDEVKVSYCLG